MSACARERHRRDEPTTHIVLVHPNIPFSAERSHYYPAKSSIVCDNVSYDSIYHWVLSPCARCVKETPRMPRINGVFQRQTVLQCL